MHTFQIDIVHPVQITIDTSPPHTGIVQDGIRGTPEVDFQQSTTLHVHWDGFFDRESGVLFYQYAFHTEPMSSSDFKLNSVNPEVHLLLMKNALVMYSGVKLLPIKKMFTNDFIL